jgi:hypothetical protein
VKTSHLRKSFSAVARAATAKFLSASKSDPSRDHQVARSRLCASIPGFEQLRRPAKIIFITAQGPLLAEGRRSSLFLEG